MKNKLIILCISCFFFINNSIAETLKFKYTNIEIAENGNLIYEIDGKAISSDGDLEINSDKFEYIPIITANIYADLLIVFLIRISKYNYSKILKK